MNTRRDIRKEEGNAVYEQVNAAAVAIHSIQDSFIDLFQRLQTDVFTRDEQIAARDILIKEKNLRIENFQKECLRLHDCISTRDLKIAELEMQLREVNAQLLSAVYKAADADPTSALNSASSASSAVKEKSPLHDPQSQIKRS